MSYNIGRVKYLTDGRLRMPAKVRRQLAKKHEAELPEICFLCEADAVTRDGDNVIIERFWWSGEGSGRADEVLTKHVLPKTTGSADLLFIWEDGDSHSGLQVRDGTVIECDVTFALVPSAK